MTPSRETEGEQCFFDVLEIIGASPERFLLKWVVCLRGLLHG